MSTKFNLKLRGTISATSVLLFAIFISGNIYGAIGPDEDDDCSYRANCYCGGSCHFAVYCCGPACDACDNCPGYCNEPEPPPGGNGGNGGLGYCECYYDWDCPSGYYCDGCYCIEEGVPECDEEYRCHNNNVEIYNTCYGWTGAIVDYCSSESSWSNWYCKTPNVKERKKSVGGCVNGSCTSSYQHDPVNCRYGCNGGHCMPKAAFTVSPNPALPGDTITLDASASRDPYGGTKLKYEWYYDGTKIGEGKILTYALSSGSVHEVKLVVTTEGLAGDPRKTVDNGTTAEAKLNLTVHEAPHPVINAPDECIVPCEAEINAIGTWDDEDDPYALKYDWDYDDGTSETFYDPTKPGKHLFSEWKNYAVKLVVTDTAGLTAQTSKDIEVKNTKPIADFTAVPMEGISPLTVKFTSKSSDPDGHNIVKYTWDFGDGTVDDGTNAEVIHTYSSAGKYNATLVVEDEYGAVSDVKSVTINVYEPKAITALSANDVLIGNATAIFVDCSNSGDSVSLQIFKQNDSGGFDAVAGGSFTVSCGGIANYTPAEVGIYKVVASIVGCSTAECTRTAYFQAKQEVPELKTPEVNPLLVLGIVLATLALIRAKK